MTQTTRIPKAALSGVQGSLLKMAIRKKIGRVPDNVAVMWNHPAVFKDLMRAGARTEKWDRVEASLASFAVMAAAAEIGCGACLDLNYFMAHNRGLAVEKAREVPRWRESTVFTPLERRVMEYAEAVCQTPPTVSDEMSAALLADSLSTAMLLVLETLAPTERAVFLLRDVFALGYGELAEAVGKSEAAVRQIAHRARTHVAERRPRNAASQAETRSALEAFMRTLETGDLQHLVDVLAPDVVALGDGGGIKQALPRPVMGADKVGKLMGVGMATARQMGMSMELVHVNGWPALLIRLDGEIDSVLSVRVEDSLVSAIYTVRNPEKLSRMMEESNLAR